MIQKIGYQKTKQIMTVVQGWYGYEKVFENEPDYIAIHMLVVRKEYQGTGRIRELLDEVFQAAQKKNLKCVLDTDTKLKKEKYLHCGMKLAKTTTLASGLHIYVLQKEPDD